MKKQYIWSDRGMLTSGGSVSMALTLAVVLSALLPGCQAPSRTNGAGGANAAAATGKNDANTDPRPYPQIMREARDLAIKQVVASSQSEDAYLRANAMETARYLPNRATPMVQRALDDPAAPVRFAALVTMGRLKLADLAPAARRRLDDPSASVRAAAMFALRASGQKADLTPLAQMLVSQDPATRGNAALILGLIGDPSAIPMLKDEARTPMPRVSGVREAIVRLQVAEAIAKLGDMSVLDAIRAGVFSQFDEVRVMAVQMLGQLEDRKYENAIGGLLDKPPVELQLVAAEALARIGYDQGLPIALDAGRHQVTAVRSQAALTLGSFRDVRAAKALVAMLDDPQEQVRLSAAAALLKAISSF
ncbi:MAG: HEAT repeat domain-containing protein [Phycisphaeraceae bacterium]